MPEPIGWGERIRAAWYWVVRTATLHVTTVLFHLRHFNFSAVPATGGVILVSNHSSFLDPIVLSIGLRRRASFMARDTLFEGPLGPLVSSLGAFPVDRDGRDIAGLREAIRRARRGALVILFPEGRRSWDGRLGAIRPGVTALVALSRAPVVPAWVEGAHRAWPKGVRLPRPRPVRIYYGSPISAEVAQAMSAEEFADLLRARLAALAARARTRRTDGSVQPPAMEERP